LLSNKMAVTIDSFLFPWFVLFKIFIIAFDWPTFIEQLYFNELLMPIEFFVNIAYDDIYSDYAAVDVKQLVSTISTQKALILVCHYTGQMHTQEKNPMFQLKAVSDWTRRFDINTKRKIQAVINKFTVRQHSNFNFINNVSSLYLIEFLLENRNELVDDHLSPQQEEDLFKAYLYFSAKWTKEQEKGIKDKGLSEENMGLLMLLPYTELFESKDFRIQFLKAVYFFKFCEGSELFNGYLNAFLRHRGLKTWNEYLFNIVSVYVTLLQRDNVKTVLDFPARNDEVFEGFETLCINPEGFHPVVDFLTLREAPVYHLGGTELLFLNINFLIDKIYHSIIFDFADILIKGGLKYKGNAITTKPQFFGIFGYEFIEPGLFFKVMKNTFRQKDYQHFNGDQLKEKFGDGAPDYLIIDNRKLYVIEFKNAMFSGPVKYSYDLERVEKEIEKKLVKNEGGRSKGVTQLMNFVQNITNGKYDTILGSEHSKYIIYPILVTTDFTFNVPLVYSIVSTKAEKILKARNLDAFNLNVRKLTMIDLDSIIKFQDLFIERKLALNHVLNDYQLFLQRGTNPIDKSLSFHKYIHLRTLNMKYGTPKMFWEETKAVMF
jgi:hypothetical protein